MKSTTPFRYVDRGKAYQHGHTEAAIKHAIRGSVMRDVPLSALVSTQRRVNTERLLQYLADPDTKPNGGSPIAVIANGRTYIHNGHHRATAALASGGDSLRMRVADLDGPRKFAAHRAPGTIAMMAPHAMEATYSPHAEPCVTIDNGLAILTVDGPLEDKPSGGWFSFFDNYEAILHRFREALESEDVQGILLKIDSPGGLAAGLNATVDRMRKLKAKSGKLVWAYADEKCCSAAYALACVADAIYLPRAAEMGSIGVTATLLDQTRADKRAGLKFAVITSGDRKADGDPHTKLTQNAIDHMKARVMDLATIYYELVADARGMSVKKIQGLQANTFTGQDAVNVGLADAVWSLPKTLRRMRTALGIDPKAGDVAQNGTDGTGADAMNVKSAAKAVRVAAKGLGKAKTSAAKTKARAALAKAEAGLLRAAKHEEDEEEDEKTPPAHEGSGSPSPSGSSGSSEEEGSSGSSAEDEEEEGSSGSSGSSMEDEEDEEEEGSSGSASSMEDEEDEEDEKRCAEDEEEISRAVKQLARSAKSKSAKSALAKLQSAVLAGQRADREVRKIAAERQSEKKSLQIDKALTARRISRSEAKMLRGQPMSFVKPFLSMRKKPIIATEEQALHTPPVSLPKTGLPAAAAQQVEDAVNASGLTGEAANKLRASLVAAQRTATAHGGMH